MAAATKSISKDHIAETRIERGRQRRRQGRIDHAHVAKAQ